MVEEEVAGNGLPHRHPFCKSKKGISHTIGAWSRLNAIDRGLFRDVKANLLQSGRGLLSWKEGESPTPKI